MTSLATVRFVRVCVPKFVDTDVSNGIAGNSINVFLYHQFSISVQHCHVGATVCNSLSKTGIQASYAISLQDAVNISYLLLIIVRLLENQHKAVFTVRALFWLIMS